jgi:hypothetical protein
MIEVPKFDDRTAADIGVIVPTLLRQRRLARDSASGRFDAALIQVFARFSELVIERLNKAPEKNFLAFLDLLGVSPLAMEAAHVPLTFSLAPGAQHAVVPAGTQVAAPAGKQSPKPVIFETESELIVTAAQLDSLLTKDGVMDRYRDLGAVLQATVGPQADTASIPAEAPSAPIGRIPHSLYIAVPVNAARPDLDQLRLHFVLDEGATPVADPRSLQWKIQTMPAPAAGTATEARSDLKILTPDLDETRNLTRTGDVVFRNVPQIASSTVNGLSAPWLSCSLLTPMTASVEPADGMLRQSQSPIVKEITAEVQVSKSNVAIEQAFHDTQKLDVTKDFFPFGERPKIGDGFYLASREAFSDADATVTLQFQLSNPDIIGPDLGIPRTKTHDTELAWEFWDGKAWAELGRTGKHLRIGAEGGDVIDTNFADETESLSKNGKVSFRFGRPPAELNANGQKNYWIRVRIAAGDYGRDLQYQKNEATGALAATPATWAPPSVRSVKLDYVVKKTSLPPAIRYNDFQYADGIPGVPYRPFIPVAIEDAPPSLYFGFTVSAPATGLPARTATGARTHPGHKTHFPRLPLSAYVLLENRTAQRREVPVADQTASRWEYWDGFEWKTFTVADRTEGIRKNGLLQFLVPADFAQSNEFGRQRYWLRMRQNPGDTVPAIRAVLLNTMTAVQGLTVVNEILGSSNGEPNQKFQTTQPSILTGQKLEVREPTMPALRERDQLRRHAPEGEDPIQPTNETPGKTEYWVTWREVSNFYGSSSRDRHYVVDRQKNEVLFGDGLCGLIPPSLPANLRLTRYRSGGGIAGNQPAQAIKQLVSAVPYVQKVTNWVAASGGSDPEQTAATLKRGPRLLRHRGRAVTAEDFEDLAQLASREVARAKCIPQFDLVAHPNADRRMPGFISMVVVPRSDDPKPEPSSDLLDRVYSFLESRRMATTDLVVVGPEYVRVDVDAEIVVESLDNASDVERQVTQAIKSYLHPIHGGPNRLGWDFGRLPQRFDLYVLIERIAGVSHIRSLRMSMVPDRPGAEKTRHFLICCGRHQVTMTL